MVIHLHGVCAGCPYTTRCHESRLRVIDQALESKDECPFYRGHRDQEEGGRMRRNTWSIARSGMAGRVIQDLQGDLDRLATDLDTEEERRVPAALLELVRGALRALDLGATRVVRVRAYATADGTGFSVDIHVPSWGTLG